ncbi:MAG: hypothetical protein HZA49_08025 [Planctomycetes bacterium]|nr:hypothetical protein [Planctomycetota bacterium]
MILLIGLSLVNCLLGCGLGRDEVVIEDPKVLSQINSLPIDERLFEAVKQNYPSIIRGLLATREELYLRMGGGVSFPGGLPEKENMQGFMRTPGSLSENPEEAVKKQKEERRRENEGRNRFNRAVADLRSLCERKGLIWCNSFLVKTTYRKGIDKKDESFNPKKLPAGIICLHISDGKASVVILAKIYYVDRAEEKLRLWGHLELDPSMGR